MVNRYTPIDPEADYDRDNFVGQFESFLDLNDYLKAVREDPENPDAKSDAGALLHGNPNFYFQTGVSARASLETAVSNSNEAIARHTKKNLGDFLGKLEGKDFVNLIMRLPLYKTGNKEYDRLIDAISDAREIRAVSEDPEKMSRYVAGKLKNAPQWLQIELSRYGNSREYMAALFQSYVIDAQRNLSQELTDKTTGEPDEKFAKKVFKESLKVAEKKEREETNEKTKKDIWKKAIRPYYEAVASSVYPIEKEDYDEEHKDAEKDRRKAERKKIGMRV
jgi:hypothetical protein